MIRRRHVERLVAIAPSRSCWSGNSGVRSSNRGRSRAASGSMPVHRVDAQQRRVLLAPAGRSGWRPSRWSPRRRPSWRVCFDRDVDVVLARQEALHPQEAVALVAEVEETGDGNGLALELLAVLLALLLVDPVAIATPAAAAAAVPALAVGISLVGLIAALVVLATLVALTALVLVRFWPPWLRFCPPPWPAWPPWRFWPRLPVLATLAGPGHPGSFGRSGCPGRCCGSGSIGVRPRRPRRCHVGGRLSAASVWRPVVSGPRSRTDRRGVTGAGSVTAVDDDLGVVRSLPRRRLRTRDRCRRSRSDAPSEGRLGRTGRRPGRRHAGEVEDLADDVGLLGPGSGLAAQCGWRSWRARRGLCAPSRRGRWNQRSRVDAPVSVRRRVFPCRCGGMWLTSGVDGAWYSRERESWVLGSPSEPFRDVRWMRTSGRRRVVTGKAGRVRHPFSPRPRRHLVPYRPRVTASNNRDIRRCDAGQPERQPPEPPSEHCIRPRSGADQAGHELVAGHDGVRRRRRPRCRSRRDRRPRSRPGGTGTGSGVWVRQANGVAWSGSSSSRHGPMLVERRDQAGEHVAVPQFERADLLGDVARRDRPRRSPRCG